MNTLIIAWLCLLLEAGLLGFTAYRYADKGGIITLICAIFIFACYVWCGVLIIMGMRLDREMEKLNKKLADTKEAIDFYHSLLLAEEQEGEEWKNDN